MLITFDTKLLIENKLDAHLFVLLQLIYEKEFDMLGNYLSNVNKRTEFANDITELITTGYLLSFRTEMYDYQNLQTTEKFTKLITGGDPFQELILTYPKSVTRPDGKTDYLLTDLPSAKKIYIKLTNKNKTLHEHVISCLKEEIETREQTNGMAYMKRLPKWISERGWESYKDQVRDLESVNGNAQGYGTKIE